MGHRDAWRRVAIVAVLVLAASAVGPVARASDPVIPNPVSGPPTDDPAAVARAGANWREEALATTNSLRKAAGRGPVKLCGTMNEAAQSWANYLASNLLFQHNGPDGSREWDRMVQSGYMPVLQPSGENISGGFDTAASAVESWTSDPEHYAVLIDGEWVDMGMGVSAGSNGWLYWVATYGNGGACTREAQKYEPSDTVEAEPSVPATVGPISVGTSTVRASLPKGAYGTVNLFWEFSACEFPKQKGGCATVTLELQPKGPDGKNLYSATEPVSVLFTCEAKACPPTTKPSRKYNPIRDFRAYPMKISMKYGQGFLPAEVPTSCQPLKSKKRATGVLGTPIARKKGFCADVFAYKRVDGVLYRTVLFVEDPRFASISR